MLRCHPDTGVPNREPQADLIVVPADKVRRHDDLALFGEFHRVADEIDQDLAEPQRIPRQLHRNGGIRPEEQLESLVLHLQRDQLDTLIEDLVEVEPGLFISSLPASILDKSRMSLRSAQQGVG